MRNEYRLLQLRLEGELLRYLEDRQACPES
jgi:hypothetical protein